MSLKFINVNSYNLSSEKVRPLLSENTQSIFNERNTTAPYIDNNDQNKTDINEIIERY